MKAFREWPVIGDLWRRGHLFPVGVAGAALVLLAQGVYSRRAAAPAPTPPPRDPPPTAEHRPSSRSGLEKTPLEYQSDFWLQLGEQARHGLVAVGRDAIPVVVERW